MFAGFLLLIDESYATQTLVIILDWTPVTLIIDGRIGKEDKKYENRQWISTILAISYFSYTP